jgi:hypothetical protein
VYCKQSLKWARTEGVLKLAKSEGVLKWVRPERVLKLAKSEWVFWGSMKMSKNWMSIKIS